MTEGKTCRRSGYEEAQEDAVKKRKPKSGGAGNEDGNDNTAKRQKKFEKAVQIQVKKILASAMEADEADDDAFTARIYAVIEERNGTTSEISAVAVAKD